MRTRAGRGRGGRRLRARGEDEKTASNFRIFVSRSWIFAWRPCNTCFIYTLHYGLAARGEILGTCEGNNDEGNLAHILGSLGVVLSSLPPASSTKNEPFRVAFFVVSSWFLRRQASFRRARLCRACLDQLFNSRERKKQPS